MSKASRDRFIIIEFPVFSSYCVHVEFTKDIQNTMRKYPSIEYTSWSDREDRDNDAVTVETDSKHMSFIFLKPSCSAGTVAHECWHAVHNMLETMGAELDNETVAYHLGYLVDQVTKLRKKRR